MSDDAELERLTVSSSTDGDPNRPIRPSPLEDTTVDGDSIVDVDGTLQQDHDDVDDDLDDSDLDDDSDASVDDSYSDGDDSDDVGYDWRSTPPKSFLTRSIKRATQYATCCYPSFIRRACRRSAILCGCYFITICIIVIAAIAGFLHIWYLYDDQANDVCFRDAATMNNFRYILQSFNEVAREFNLPYWADFGVLLGGVQRHDVLPWDRDIDLSMMKETFEEIRSNQAIQHALFNRGLWVCPSRKCIQPVWNMYHFPEIDVNLWEIDGDTVRYVREENVKDDKIRELVFSQYYDFPKSYLYPLTNLSIGTVDMSVPHEYESVLRLRYPHSYGWSLPYNPRCWWSALTSGLPSPTEMTITDPPNARVTWFPPNPQPIDTQSRFIYDAKQHKVIVNPHFKGDNHQAVDIHQKP